MSDFQRNAPSEAVQALIAQGNKRGLYDTSKNGPEMIAFMHDRAGMLAALRDEMSDEYQGWLDAAVLAMDAARDRLADALQEVAA